MDALHRSAAHLVPEVPQVLQTSHEVTPDLGAVQAAVSWQHLCGSWSCTFAIAQALWV